MNRYHIRKRIAKIKKHRKVLLGAEDVIMSEAGLLREDCHNTFISLWKQYGLKGEPTSSSHAFQGGIVAKDWTPGTFMVFDFGDENLLDFCERVTKIASAFYKDTGIKLCVRTPDGKFAHLPKASH
jgi:hypothetical protein